ncbi:MAG TPA: alpha-amylase [Chromatiaceae bacterium]|jgi:amylosucrase|nr:MAG: alpha-amylase [Thiohalocapsa sp. PB-PSB1]QQO52376.1 MAG: alpha-amylase [Thiohalocapsa sp. PB-PSB1]HBG97014.1 alpha-amylase [Chromatiaceae bacterium]HCS92573.1 alpha-amylase [Chromatiaceae bacterium]
MYEQVSHSLLNDILTDLKPEIHKQDLRHFYTRLGANFYSIYSLFFTLYGKRDDVDQQMQKLVETMARQYIGRPEPLRESDIAREKDHNWFLSQEWVGMAQYADGYAQNLSELRQRMHYFLELGVNMVHLMPMMQCPSGASDGGYAVSDFRQINKRFGSLEDLQQLAEEFHKYGILLTLDVVLNHTSNEHEWAQKARSGDPKFQDYYYIFDNREVPEMFEATMPEVFPETAPGNFTWDESMGKWVMTVFNDYQWDLNYGNPAVFIEMLDIILYWANQGADILRLDAVAFLWKKIGSLCQNEREAHLLLQLLKDCCQVTAPGVLFIAEAIVAPVEIIKYFGEDAINAKECEIAYNASLMALLWDAIATKNAKLLNQGIQNLPDKLERATWLNYIRCHDDIGLGYDDNDIRAVNYEPYAHRQFLIDYYTGKYKGSSSRGLPFGYNDKTGDSRISGSLASLVGLEAALESGDQKEIDDAVKIILLLHGITMSFGGMPLLYYGDEIGTLNDRSYIEDPAKANDSRWTHRPRIKWENVELRNTPGTIEHQLFSALKKMIAVRKEIPAFADFNNRKLLQVSNPHLFVFSRFQYDQPANRVLVIANFDHAPQYLGLEDLGREAYFRTGTLRDLYSGESPIMHKEDLIIPSHTFYWLSDQLS